MLGNLEFRMLITSRKNLSEVIVENNYRALLSVENEVFGNAKAEASEAGA